jgi:hypothetical protein
MFLKEYSWRVKKQWTFRVDNLATICEPFA